MLRSMFQAADHVSLYAKYRPHYPQALHDSIFKFCRERGNQFNTALDAGCGTGISTYPLVPKFKSVLGIDISQPQLKIARQQYPELRFKEGDAGNMFFIPDNSVDLVTVGTAVHWLDFQKFGVEVDRILTPASGVVAIYTYFPEIYFGNQKLDDLYSELYYNNLDKYAKRKIYRKFMEDLTLPYKDFHSADFQTKKQMNLDGLLKFIKSFSSYPLYSKENPDSCILEMFAQDFLSLNKNRDTFVASWPMVLSMWSNSVCDVKPHNKIDNEAVLHHH